MKTEGLTLRTLEWGPLIMLSAGSVVFSLGIGRFIVRHSFSFRDALNLCLTLVPAWLLLLVIAYVVQHAKLVSVIPLSMAGLLGFSFPVFDVAFGFVLMCMIVAPAFNDWRSKKIPLESATTQESVGEALNHDARRR